MKKKVIIEVDQDGNPSIQTFGFAGTECRLATKSLQDELGVTLSDQDTAEAHMTVPARVKAGGGVR